MKTFFAALALALAATACHPGPPPPPVTVIHVEAAGPPHVLAPFVEPLEPWGRWFMFGQYGWVWTPTTVDPDWRPYANGHWTWTDDGWMWISDEPWGWATYHYGRWVYDGAFGWIWVPDTEWAPAWVCWRTGGPYIGWAPLPPGVVIGAGMVACEPWIGGWVFVETDVFLVIHVHDHVVPAVRNDSVHRHTRTVQTTTTREHYRYPAGPARESIAPDAPVRRVVESDRESLDSDRVTVVRPKFDGDVAASRVKSTPGAVRMDQPPFDGQHKPEVRTSRPTQSPIPAGSRGPKVPTKEKETKKETKEKESPREKKVEKGRGAG